MSGPAPQDLAGLSVLVVEDELLLALDYATLLEGRGCVVLGPAPDEARAMAALEAQRPDVAVLDLNLAGARPAALAEALRAQGVPFLVVTGYGLQGAAGHPALDDAPRLEKPVAPEALLSRLGRLARR